MSDILVSVIVPVYNSGVFLDRCISSIISQSYSNIEVILVNDGSTDNSQSICEKYASMDGRVRVINKVNGGLVSSRKAGLNLSTGDYILYVDGDDWIEFNLLKVYTKQVLKFDADVVISSHMVNLEGYTTTLKNLMPIGLYDKEKLRSMIYPKMMYSGKFSQFGIYSYSWGKLYRKSTLLQNQLNVSEDITIGEDALCLYPTLIDASTLVILDQPYYHYRQRADSLIKTLRTVEISKMQKVYTHLKQAFDKKNVLDIMLSQIQYYLLSLLIINTEGPILGNNAELYPFTGVELGDSVVICGGGTFGQHLHKKINKDKTYNIVAWIDERYEHYSKINLPVTELASIKSTNYDAVLVALIDEDNSNQVISKLVDCGVDRDKIIQVSHYGDQDIQRILLEYKIKL